MREQQELLFTEPCPQTLLHSLAPLMGKWSNITESNPRMSSMLKCVYPGNRYAESAFVFQRRRVKGGRVQLKQSKGGRQEKPNCTSIPAPPRKYFFKLGKIKERLKKKTTYTILPQIGCMLQEINKATFP